jgi:hypothetical protein
MMLNFLTVLLTPFRGLKFSFSITDIIYGAPYNPKKFGVYACGLGYTIKYPDDFFRYDYPPRLIINFFKKQIVIDVLPKTSVSCEREYWEAWWNYRNKTDKKATVSFRLNQLFNSLSLTFIQLSNKNDKEVKIDYFPHILKDKYVFYYLILDKLKTII